MIKKWFKVGVVMVVVAGVFWVLVSPAVLVTESRAATTCLGVVQRQIPVYIDAARDSGYTGAEFYPYLQVAVSTVVFDTHTGEIWYEVPGGWIQSYTGYTTGVNTVLLADFDCPAALPVVIR